MRGRTHTRTDAHTQVTPPKMQRKAFVIRTQLLEPLSHLSPPGLVRYAGAVKNGWSLLHTTSTHYCGRDVGLWVYTDEKPIQISAWCYLIIKTAVQISSSYTLKLLNYTCGMFWNERECIQTVSFFGVFSNNKSSKSSFHQVLTIESQVCSVFLCLI